MLSKRTIPTSLLIVLSAPSGAGKTTLAKRLLARHPDMVRSISCTTRRPRGAEQEGKDYFFISEEEFKKRLAKGEFLEHAEVHGKLYGTLKKSVEDLMKKVRTVLMIIDVQGARQVRQYCRSKPAGWEGMRCLDVFIMPPSLDTLKQRLLKRAEDAHDVVARRLENAQLEIKSAKEFKCVIVNNELGQAVGDLERVIEYESGK